MTRSDNRETGLEVSGTALEPFKMVSKSVSGSESTLFSGLEHLLDHPRRFAWEEVCTLYERLDDLIRGQLTLRQCGHLMFDAPEMSDVVRAASAVASPALLYTLGHRFGIKRVFSHLASEQATVGTDHIRVDIRIPETHRHCPQFFMLTQGVLEAFPALLGLPHARVVLTLEERHGRYDVHPPASRTIFARFVRAWRAFFAGQKVLEQLDQQQVELNMQYRALEDAYTETKRALEVKQRFLSVMSHELRTPLNGIIGAAEGLDREEDETMRRELQDALTHSARQMGRLVEGVLELARTTDIASHPSLTDFDLCPLFHDVLGYWQRQVEEEVPGVELRVERGPNLPIRIETDELRVRQIVDRLVDNAVKFTPKGTITVRVAFENGALVIAVRDTGIGIDEGRRDVIFDLFTQLDDTATRRYGGAGLGLALVARNVEVLGGRVDVESELGEGSTFTVRIPARVIDPPPLEEASKRDAILVVDDNRINRLVVTRMLKKLGWKVREAENGEEAVAAATTEDFAMIFMDCEMPVMNGWDATARITKEKGDTVPIVALTAYVSDEDRARCREVGMCDFLPKPIASDIVERTLMRWTHRVSPETAPSEAASNGPSAEARI